MGMSAMVRMVITAAATVAIAIVIQLTLGQVFDSMSVSFGLVASNLTMTTGWHAIAANNASSMPKIFAEGVVYAVIAVLVWMGLGVFKEVDYVV